jgi:hypothetical protein
MDSKFLKGLFMALIGALAPIVSTNPIIWGIVAITTIGTALIYVGKNAIKPLRSNSPQGTFDLINTISGILIAIGSAIISGMASFVVGGIINWHLLWYTLVTVSGTYIVSTYFEGTPPNKVI